MMDCRQAEELAGAYALGALTPEEHRGFVEHLRTCGLHADVGELELVAAVLARSVSEMDPPPALKARLMDEIRRDAPVQQATPIPARPGLFGALRGLFAGRLVPYAVGALAVLVAAIVVGGIVLQSDSDGGSSTSAVLVVAGSATRVGEVLIAPGRDSATVTVDQLEPPPAGQTYQLWALDEGRPASIGFLDVTGEGGAEASVSADLSSADAIAVTLEPAGGSPEPTTPVLFIAELS